MTQNLSVARALLISSLLRSDAPAPDVSREEATLFARTLLRTCNVCTTSNIRLCKLFITENILPSNHRTIALGKYLVTISKSFEPRDPISRIDTTKLGDENEGLGKIVNGKLQQPPDPALKRLHVLYIIHDVLCYCHLHPPKSGAPQKLKDQVLLLAQLAACDSTSKPTKTSPAILDLIAFWERIDLFDQSSISTLRSKIQLADTEDWSSALTRLNAEEETRSQAEKLSRDAATKWRLPERHSVPHDPSAPWHELPAANGLYMQRIYGSPLHASAFPAGGYKLPHAGTEALANLQGAVEKLHSEALRCFEKFTPAEEVQDIDALGNVIWKDPERPTRNFWGFSLEGVEKRRELAREFKENARGYAGIVEDGRGVSDAVERARALAAGRGQGAMRGRAGYPGRGGWRGAQRW